MKAATKRNIGSTTQLRNEDNTFAGDYEYTPYGQSWHAGGATTDHQFTGKYRDTKADLYYFPYRNYSPALARWVTPDPLGMIDGPNLYSYVRNSPTTNWDPTGQFAWLPVCCLACGLFLALDIYEAITSTCAGLTGRAFYDCLFNKLAFGNSCLRAAILGSSSADDMAKKILECVKCDVLGAARDVGKAASCACCLGTWVIRFLPKVPPVPDPLPVPL